MPNRDKPVQYLIAHDTARPELTRQVRDADPENVAHESSRQNRKGAPK